MEKEFSDENQEGKYIIASFCNFIHDKTPSFEYEPQLNSAAVINTLTDEIVVREENEPNYLLYMTNPPRLLVLGN